MPTVYNKVVIDGVVKIDLSGDTVTSAEHILAGHTGHLANGNQVPGTGSGGSPNLQAKTNVSPSTSSQTITADSGYDGLSSVQINAMPTGTAGTPTATKGTVSNHSVTVTPSVTNTTGYITGSTKTGTAVTVSASELVSGSETKTENGTYDVTNLASLVVNVASGGGSSYKLLATQEFSVSTTSSTATSVGYVDISPLSDIWTASKIIYVKIRRKSGATSGNFYGSDAWFINDNAIKGGSQNCQHSALSVWKCNNSGDIVYSTSSNYGVYPYQITTGGRVQIYRRYNSTYSSTINGTFVVSVYALDPPSGTNPLS